MKRVLQIITCLLLTTELCFGSITNLISYQGVLKDAVTGNIVANGNYSMTFKLYTDLVGGVAIWTETQNSVAITNGIFSVQLGSVTPLNLTNSHYNTSLYLGITVGATELSPRTPINIQPYSSNTNAIIGIGVDYSTAPTNGQYLMFNGTNWVPSTVTASSATNLNGGGANTVVYQSASGTTAYLANGTTGQVLTATTGNAPSWTNLAGTGDILNGGNSGTVTIGTNDAFGLNFETNGITRLSINIAGRMTTDLIFKGSTSGDANYTTLTITDPNSPRTITFPNASGTVSLTSDLSDYVHKTTTVNVKALSGNLTLSLASADFGNQGTTSTVLHGNAVGNPYFSAVSLTADVSGTLPVGNGGTGLTGYGTALQVLRTNATTNALEWATIASGGDILNGGNSGTVTIGTNDATGLNLETQNVNRITISNTGSIAIPAFSTAGILHNNASGILSSSEIVNADVSATASIAGSKITPSFGAQAVTSSTSISTTSTGTITSAGLLTASSGLTVSDGKTVLSSVTITENANGTLTSGKTIYFISPTTGSSVTWNMPAESIAGTIVYIYYKIFNGSSQLTLQQNNGAALKAFTSSKSVGAILIYNGTIWNLICWNEY